jgi:nitric oxide synthase-interacting protein
MPYFQTKNSFRSSPDGWIFEKEAILEYILKCKIANSKLLKEFANQKKEKNKELNELAEIQHREKLEKFMKTEGKLVQSSVGSSAASTSKTADSEKVSVCNMNPNNKAKLPSFWIPSLAPESKTKAPMKKPDTTIYCPMSKKPLSMKDLIEVKFKLLDDKNDNRSLIVKQDRYVCPVSNDVLGNNVPCCVLKPS